MADTSSQPSLSKKLGGIPHGQRTSPGAYRKPSSFEMKAIPRPAEHKPVARARPAKSSKAGIFTALILVALAGGGGALVYCKKAELLALIERQKSAAPAPVVIGPAPADTSPIADASEGWLWLFPEREWRATGQPDREFKGGLIQLRKPMEKPQPEADGSIRARFVIRDGSSGAGVVMRSTAEGRYRLSVDPDFSHVRLARQGRKATKELGKYRFPRSLLKGDRLTLELRADGEKLFGFVDGELVIEAQDDQLAKAGNWGIEGKDAMFELVEVPVPRPAARIAEKEPEPAAPMPAATPVPVPVPSETAKWLTGAEGTWQAGFERDVLAPFNQGIGELKKQFIAALDSQIVVATQSRKLDDAAALRGERQRLADGGDVPMTDEAAVPPVLQQLRHVFRGNFVRLDAERFNRAKTFHTSVDATLAQTEAALLQRQRAEEAAEIKAKRGQIAALWLKPAANLPPPPTVAARTPPGGTPAPSSTMKMTPRNTAEKLLAIGAGVWVNQREVKAVTELPGDRFTISRVEFPRLKPDSKPIAAEDYALLDGLAEVNELTLRGGPAVTEEVMEKLRTFRSLRRLSLDGLTGFKTPGYAVLPMLSDLQVLEIRNMSPGEDAMKLVSQCRKVTRLVLTNLPIGDEVFAGIAKMPALTDLSLNDLEKITSPAIAHLTECKGLRRLTMGGFTVTSPMLEAVARCSGLEAFTLSGNPLKDDQIMALSALSRLQTLGLSGTEVVGTAFAKWPTRTSLQALNLGRAAGVNDEALKAIASAFPRLETLEFKIAPSGAGLPGFSAVGRLRNLRTLRISGEGVNDELAVEIGKAGELQYLSLDGARLTDPGAAALARLTKLTDLRIDHPPVTDAALKSFGKLKMLKSMTIADDAPPETETKLRATLTGVAIRRGG
jgi:Leucine-rich repeat (LRR) protein